MTKGIGMTIIQVNTIKAHEPYQEYLNLIKRYKVNLIIELPRLPPDGDTSKRLRTHISRVQQCASVANKVYVIAPMANKYWPEWESHFNDQNGYFTTHHEWCGLGVRDKDSGKPLHSVTRIVSNDHSIRHHRCQCDVKDHIHSSSMRKLKNDEEQSQRKSAPHQKSLSDWAIKIIDILKLKPGGPRLNKDGQEVYDVAPTGYRWKHGPGSRSDKTEGTTTGIEFKGSADQEPGGG